MSQSNDDKKKSSAVLINITNGEKHFINKDQIFIGRHENCAVCVTNFQVSRKHCVINRLPESSSFTIQDLSNHGTFVNGIRLVKNFVHILGHHDKINLAGKEELTFEFMINKKYQSALEQSKALDSNLKEKIIDLDSTHCEEMKKVTKQINDFERERNFLKEELNSLLSAQDNYFKQERDSLSNLLISSNDQKMEAEERIKNMETAYAEEKSILMQENERKLNVVAKREKELQKSKLEIEERYQKERVELEKRYRIEVEALKEKLAESEHMQDRLKEETLEAEQKLEETKKTLLESELEQFRLHQEKVAVESKLESKIVNLTQESTSKEEMVKMLETRLKEKEKEEQIFKKEMEDLGEEIVCSICTELFIEPLVLNCGHLFCQLCIEEWKAKKNSCPMCRVKIKSCVRMRTVDSIINRSVKLMPAEMQKRRQELIKERSGASSKVEGPARKRKKSARNEFTPYGNPLTRNLHMENYTRTGDQMHNYVARARFEDNSMIPVHSIASRPIQNLAGASGTAGNTTPAPGPSTAIRFIDLEPDPFGWGQGLAAISPDSTPRTESPVPVAAIDLTNFSTPTQLPRRQRYAPSTATSSTDTTIDLTST